MEFKKELRVKFANSTVRTAALRDKLQSIAFEGPQYMEQYISQFRTLEVQIPSEEMAFGDRLHYFIRPLPLKCQRTIKLEHPRSMETVYDAAIDWAYVNGDGKQQKSIFDSTDKAKSLIETAQQILDNGKRIGEFSDDELDILDMASLQNIKCYNCNERGHLAKDCPKPSRRVRDMKSNDKTKHKLMMLEAESDTDSDGSEIIANPYLLR